MLVKQITQKDRYTFAIEWTDGLISHYRLNQLQKNCPCIACREKRLLRDRDEVQVHEGVMAFRIRSFGRFALKIEFTSGCSNGIYPYSLLRRISQ